MNDNFIGGIKSAVSDLVHGVCDHIHLGDYDASEVIWHDSALEPHWNLAHLHGANPWGNGMNFTLIDEHPVERGYDVPALQQTPLGKYKRSRLLSHKLYKYATCNP